MMCGLDPVCYAGQAWGAFVSALPWWAPWAFWLSVSLVAIGFVWKVIDLGFALGGRLGAAGALGVVATASAAIWSFFRRLKHPAPKGAVSKPDPKPRKPARFNPDTNKWE